MQRLWPSPSGRDLSDDEVGEALAALARPSPGTRPWLATNMVTSIDGAASRSGRSGGLGGPGDRRMFHLVRGLPDAIVVGAGTVRAERYGPVLARNAEGATPRLAIVSARLDLDPSLPCFVDNPDGQRPLVLTVTTAEPARRRALEPLAEVVELGTDTMEAPAILAALWDRGSAVVLCEGGPTLLGQFVQADLVDEWFVTLAGVAIGGGGARITQGAAEVDHRLAVRTIFAEGADLFLSHVRADPSPDR